MAADFAHAMAPPIAPDAPAPDHAPAPTEIAFVDGRVVGQDALTLQRDGMLVVVLDTNQDGVAQISEVLAQHHDVKAVHILAHGDAGEMFLGNSVLDAKAVADGKVADWGKSLTKDGDVLLYGCNVAEGEAGQGFVKQLAAATGADVGASTDATGNAAKGGNDILEFTVGALETAPLSVSALNSLLAPVNGTGSNDTLVFGTDFTWGDIVDGKAGTDLLNFTSASTDLTFTITGLNSITITDATHTGANSITATNIESLTGGSGADTFAFNSGGSVAGAITGGTGSDKLDYSALSTAVDVDLTAGTATLAGSISGIENATGGSGADTLKGSSAANLLIGNDGADTLYGTAGGDTLDGGLGIDTLDYSAIASALTFAITTTPGAVNVTGLATAATGIESLVGGTGVNTFSFAAGASLAGSITGNGALNTLDYSSYGSGVTVNLATGAATGVSGTVSEITRVVGSNSADDITDGGDGDTYEGGGGDDIYRFGDDWGTDTITDSAGANTLDFSDATAGANFALNGATTVVTEGANKLTLTLTGASTLAEIHGSAGDDVFTADLGLTVQTNLYGGDGDDSFQPQAGSDFAGVVDGEGGTDTLDFSLRGGNVKFDATTGAPENFSGTIDHVEQIQHPLTVPNGVASVAGLIQDGINATVGNVDLPLLGNVGSEATSFIDDIATTIVDGMTAQLVVAYGDTRSTGDIIEDYLTATLQVNFTSLIPGATVGTFGLVAIDSNHMEFALVLQGVIFHDVWDIDFGGAIPGLGLNVDAQLDVNLTYSMRLAFGVDYSSPLHPEFYFDTNGANDTDPSDDDELTLSLSATLANGDVNDPQLLAVLGFLQFEVTSYDNSHQKTQDDSSVNSPYQDSRSSGIFGSFAIDLKDPGADIANAAWAQDDGRLTKTEFSDSHFSLKDNLAAKFSAVADVDLFARLSADALAGGLPSIQFYLHYDQTFVDAEIAFNGTTSDQSTFGGAPTVVIEDLSLNLGSFLSDFITPLFAQIQTYTEPLQPIVDFLKADIPILSDIGFLKDLLNKDGQGGVDVLDFAGTILGSTKYASIVTAVNAIVELIDLVNSIPTDGDILINFGTYTFGGGSNDLRGSGSQMSMPDTSGYNSDNKINNSSATPETKSFLSQAQARSGRRRLLDADPHRAGGNPQADHGPHRGPGALRPAATELRFRLPQVRAARVPAQHGAGRGLPGHRAARLRLRLLGHQGLHRQWRQRPGADLPWLLHRRPRHPGDRQRPR